MKFTTNDNREITWFDGILAGDDLLVEAVKVAVQNGLPCSFDYWGEQPASIVTEFRAYLTIGHVLVSLYEVAVVDVIPDNPDGYEPEGPVYDAAEPSAVAAAAVRRYVRDH